MKKYPYIIFLVFLLKSNSFYSQTIKKTDIQYGICNTITNGFIGGIGSMIHKHNDESFGNAFINGFKNGCISGVINSFSKQLLAYEATKDNVDWKIMWSSKIINSVSNTILYNASINEKNILKNYSINIGFVRFSTNEYVQIDPVSLLCTGYILNHGGKFELNNSLSIGTPVFDYKFKRKIEQINGSYCSTPEHFGEILGQNIMLQHNAYCNQVFIHEITHTYQRLQYTNINNFSNFYLKHEKIFIFHNDISVFDLLYIIQNKTIGYNKNYFESESNHYGRN